MSYKVRPSGLGSPSEPQDEKSSDPITKTPPGIWTMSFTLGVLGLHGHLLADVGGWHSSDTLSVHQEL